MTQNRLRAIPVIFSTCALMLLASCGSSSKAATVTTVPPTAAPVTTVSTTPTSPPLTTPAKAATGFPSGAAAAAHLVEAWRNQDKPSAAQGADAEAVTGIFATPDPTMWLRGCSDDNTLEEGGCIYLTQHGAVTINTEKRAIGWVVSTADYGTR